MPDEIEPLTAYLAATYGPDSPVPRGEADTSSLPDGRGRAILVRSCVQCHGLGMVTNARKSEPEWNETIRRMTDYGTEITTEERQVLVNYVASHFGAQ